MLSDTVEILTFVNDRFQRKQRFWDELCLDFWPQKVAQQYGSEQLWGEFCLDFWPKKVAQRHGLGQLWGELCLDFLVQR